MGWLGADLEGHGRLEADQLADEDEVDAVGARRIAHVLLGISDRERLFLGHAMPLTRPTREPSGQAFRLVVLGGSLEGGPLFEEGG